MLEAKTTWGTGGFFWMYNKAAQRNKHRAALTGYCTIDLLKNWEEEYLCLKINQVYVREEDGCL